MNVPQGMGIEGGSATTGAIRTTAGGTGTGGGRAGAAVLGADEHTPTSMRLTERTDVRPPTNTPALFIRIPPAQPDAAEKTPGRLVSGSKSLIGVTRRIPKGLWKVNRNSIR